MSSPDSPRMPGRRRDWTTPGLALVALSLAVLAWYQGGAPLALDGIGRGLATLWSVLPLLIAAFLVAGFTQTLISRHLIERWLGSASGLRGILIACLAGALIPGGPYVYYPIAGALLHSGASLGALVAFVSAKNLGSLTRLPLEVALLGPRLTVIRYLLTLLVPPLVGVLAQAIYGHWLARIRETAP